MTLPSVSKGSSEDTEQFFQKLERMTDSPSLSEEFHERLRQKLKHNFASPEEVAQGYVIRTPQPSATQVIKAINFKAIKRSIRLKVMSFLRRNKGLLLFTFFGTLLIDTLLFNRTIGLFRAPRSHIELGHEANPKDLRQHTQRPINNTVTILILTDDELQEYHVDKDMLKTIQSAIDTYYERYLLKEEHKD